MIQTQSPTRVDLAGGTLDCWPLYPLVGNCVTVNLAIDIYTGCQLQPFDSKKIEVEISDLNYRAEFSNLTELLASSAADLKLVRHILDYFRPTEGFHLKTYSQSPVGGGLGGSSSLCISLIKAFCQWQKINKSLPEMVTLASHIEAKIIHSPTGTQDYFPAIQPGLNVIHYTCDGARLERLNVDLKGFAENLLLVYTGKAHHSGINNWQVIKAVVEGDKTTLAALREISLIALDTAEVCRRGQWGQLPQLFRSEFDSRVKLAKAFSSPEIERLKKLVCGLGAEAVKICGAGGGGCVLVWAAPDLHERISAECPKNGFQPIRIRPVTGLATR